MAIATRFAAFVLLLGTGAACKGRPLVAGDAGGGTGTFTGADAGGAADVAQAPDVAQTVDAATAADARRDWVAIDTAEYLACASDDDCVAAWYPQPVMSEADCYCRNCALVPLNKATDALFAAQWAQYCTAWLANTTCAFFACPAPPLIRCVGGLCLAGSWVVPSTCQADQSSGCPNAIACRGGCCQPGEWCDDQIGCRCGYKGACPVGQTCGHMYAGSEGKGFCGDVCCFDCAP